MLQNPQIRTVVYSQNSMYDNHDPHTIQTSDSENVYKYFSELLNKDSEDFVVFHRNKLLNRSSSFQNQKNDQYYEVHLIQEMKEHLNCYDSQIRSLKSYIKELEEQLQQKTNYLEQIIHSFYQTNNQEAQQQKIIESRLFNQQSHINRDLESRNKEISAILTSDLYLQSSIIEMQSICIFCQNQIDGERLQTQCYHDYHLECFKCFIESQIDTAVFLQCICKKKVPLKILYLLKNQAEIGLLFNKIYQNQLIQIQNNVKFQNLQVIKCKNQCQVFYLENVNQEVNSYLCYDCMSQ